MFQKHLQLKFDTQPPCVKNSLYFNANISSQVRSWITEENVVIKEKAVG